MHNLSLRQNLCRHLGIEADRPQLDALRIKPSMVNPRLKPRRFQRAVRRTGPAEPQVDDVLTPILIGAYFLIQPGVPKRAQRGHHMHMGVSIALVVDHPVRRRPTADQRCLHKIPHQRDALLMR